MKRIILLLLIITSAIYSFCQDFVNDPNLPILENISIPSPTSSGLGQYGYYSIGEFTGTAQIPINIYTLKTKHLSVPISINYSSNGVRVDKVSSWVGMDWDLFAGGVITRTVYDKPDEETDLFYTGNPHAATFDNSSRYFISHFYNNSLVDAQPDIFSFNFQGRTGRFIYDRKNNQIKQIPFTDMEIEMVFNMSSWNEIEEIIITDEEGIKYHFGTNGHFETSNTIAQGESAASRVFWNIQSAWYLSKIEHPYGEYIEFDYYNNIYSYPVRINQILSQFIPNLSNFQNLDDSFCDCLSENEYDRDNNTFIVRNEVNGQSLKSIATSDGETIEFSVTNSRPDLPSSHRLNNIIVKNQQGELVKNITLQYSFPYSYGSLNACANNYPELHYRMYLDDLVFKDTNGDEEFRYSFMYDNSEDLPPRLSFSQDYYGYFNGKDNGISDFIPIELFQYTRRYPAVDLSSYGADRTPDSNYSKYGLLSKIILPTSGYTELEYEANGSSSPESKPSGLRVSKITNYDGQKEIIRRFYYNSYENRNEPVSYITDPVNDNYTTSKFLPPCAVPLYRCFGDCVKEYFGASNYNIGKMQCFYPIVTTSYGNDFEGGGLENHYFFDINYPALVKQGDVILGVPNIDASWKNGTLQEKVEFAIENFEKSIKRQTEYFYSEDYTKSESIYGDVLRSPGQLPSLEVYTVSQDDVDFCEEKYCPFNHKHVYKYDEINEEWFCEPNKTKYDEAIDKSFWESQGMNVSPNGMLCWNIFNSRNKEVGDPFYTDSPYEYFSISTYYLISGCNKLDSIISTVFGNIEEESVVTKKYFKYNQNGYSTLASKTNFGNGSKQITTHVKYPQDYEIDNNNEIIHPIADLLSKNILLPIEVYETIDDKVISSSITNFSNINDKIFPINKHTLQLQVPLEIKTDDSDPLKFRPSFFEYDETNDNWFLESDNHYSSDPEVSNTWSNEGNLVEVYKKDGAQTSFIWGYEGTLVIAKANNSAADEIFYESFEEGDIHGWYCPGTEFTYEASVGPDEIFEDDLVFLIDNGEYIKLTLNTTDHSFISSKNYRVSVKGKALSTSANNPVLKVVNNGTVYTKSVPKINSWKVVSIDFPYAGGDVYIYLDADLGGSDAADDTYFNDLRVFPANAQMATYTYDPLVGMTSQTDPNGKTTHYEYDDFGRLKAIKDSEGNVIQETEYNYATQ